MRTPYHLLAYGSRNIIYSWRIRSTWCCYLNDWCRLRVDFFLWCHVGQSFIPDGELSSMNCFFCYAPRSFLPVTSNVFFRYEAADTSAWGSPFTADMIAASLCVHGVVDLPNHRCSLHSWSWSTKIKLQQYSAASSSCKIA